MHSRPTQTGGTTDNKRPKMASPQTRDAGSNAALEQTSFLYGANAPFIEAQLERYLADPSSVDESWRNFFASIAPSDLGVHRASWARADWPEATDDLTRALTGAPAAPKADAKPGKAPIKDASVKELQQKIAAAAPTLTSDEVRRAVVDTVRAIQMIRAYRVRGTLEADLDPLRLTPPASHPELDPASYGFGPDDLDRPIFIDGMLGLETATVRQMLDILRRT